MARPPKEYQAFTSLVDKLLTVPKDEVLKREAEYKAEAAKSPRCNQPLSPRRARSRRLLRSDSRR
jgi:hypothetical protein